MSSDLTAKETLRMFVANSREPFDALRDLREAIDVVTEEEVQRARNLGAPWRIIADRLGITRQTAVTRYGDPDTD